MEVSFQKPVRSNVSCQRQNVISWTIYFPCYSFKDNCTAEIPLKLVTKIESTVYQITLVLT